jgi:hypothetical protein
MIFNHGVRRNEPSFKASLTTSALTLPLLGDHNSVDVVAHARAAWRGRGIVCRLQTPTAVLLVDSVWPIWTCHSLAKCQITIAQVKL